MKKIKEKRNEIKNFLHLIVSNDKLIMETKMTTSGNNTYIHFMIDKFILYDGNRIKKVAQILQHKYKEIPLNIKIYDNNWMLLREYE